MITNLRLPSLLCALLLTVSSTPASASTIGIAQGNFTMNNCSQGGTCIGTQTISGIDYAVLMKDGIVQQTIPWPVGATGMSGISISDDGRYIAVRTSSPTGGASYVGSVSDLSTLRELPNGVTVSRVDNFGTAYGDQGVPVRVSNANIITELPSAAGTINGGVVGDVTTFGGTTVAVGQAGFGGVDRYAHAWINGVAQQLGGVGSTAPRVAFDASAILGQTPTDLGFWSGPGFANWTSFGVDTSLFSFGDIANQFWSVLNYDDGFDAYAMVWTFDRGLIPFSQFLFESEGLTISQSSIRRITGITPYLDPFGVQRFNFGGEGSGVTGEGFRIPDNYRYDDLGTTPPNSEVPEPFTGALVGSGILGLIEARRRRNRKLAPSA